MRTLGFQGWFWLVLAGSGWFWPIPSIQGHFHQSPVTVVNHRATAPYRFLAGLLYDSLYLKKP